MCGIAGLLGETDLVKAREALNGMNACLSHRGPDDEGVFVDRNVGLGQRRLSIIDLSAAGHQPMFSEDGRFSMVFNGEIYNFQKLKQELQSSYSFKTKTDSEVLLAAWITWREKCLDKLEGMFAFAVWDQLEQTLFIARDRLGIKPLYYYHSGGKLVFGSEIRSLLSSGFVPRKLDSSTIHEYLRFQTVHAPRTLIKDVFMLEPGHYLFYSPGKPLTIKQFWSTAVTKKAAPSAYSAVTGRVKQLLEAAVEKRLISDVPFGAFLSGGIDSSVIVALMAKYTEKVKTFNVSFDESEFSESRYARVVADLYKTEHHEILLTPEHFLSRLPSALDAMDFPSGDGPNTFIVSEATKKEGITMALSGLGGDELFAGYPVFRRGMDLYKYKFFFQTPFFLRKLAAQIVKASGKSVSSEKLADLLLEPSFDLSTIVSGSRSVFTKSQLKDLLKHYGSSRIPFSEKEEHGFLLTFISQLEITGYMQNVLLRDTDQMSMAHALEVRVPFLDHHLVEYVLSLPDHYKYPHTPKKLLTDSFKGIIPESLINRPKMGFTLPWQKWLKTELKGFCEQQIKHFSKRSFVNEVAVLQLWQRFQNNDPAVPWSRVWHLVVLEHWLTKQQIIE